MSSNNFLNSPSKPFLRRRSFLSTSFGVSNYQNQEPHRSASSSTIELLPNSVILEILLKLPVKSIITCKCVCKSWHDLISDPSFAITYATNPPQYSAIVWSYHRTVTSPLDDGSFGFAEIGGKDGLLSVPFNPKALDFPQSRISRIVSSCNGFVCLVKTPQPENQSNDDGCGYIRDSRFNNEKVYVVNPLLGECIELPRVRGSKHISSVKYGFGVSTASNEYKVVRLVAKYIYFSRHSDDGLKFYVEIFTVGIDKEWRCFENPNTLSYIYPMGVPLSGVLHWIGYNGHNGVIYAFDVGEESGECFPFPPSVVNAVVYARLAVWHGQLCFIDNSSEVQVDVWTMKKYGVVDSWTRDIILRRHIPRVLRPHPLMPITTLSNGELLLHPAYHQSLISFDPETKKCRKLIVSHVEGTKKCSKLIFSHVKGPISCFCGYTPSFFSLRNASKIC